MEPRRVIYSNKSSEWDLLYGTYGTYMCKTSMSEHFVGICGFVNCEAGKEVSKGCMDVCTYVSCMSRD